MAPREANSSGTEVRGRFVPDAVLYRPRPWRGLAALAADWALIAAAFSAALLWPSLPTYLLAAIVIGRTQLALAVMMHESAHGLLLPSQAANDAVGQAFAAGPLCLSLKTYRAGHLKHHRAPMRFDDPVAIIFGVNDYPIGRRELILRLVSDLLGIGNLVTARKFMRGDFRGLVPAFDNCARHKAWELSTMLASNGLILGALAACGHAWLYLGLWTLPSLTLLQFFGRIRAIMEHAGLPECEDQSRNARTIVRPSWQTFLFGPHGIHYHIEHHLFVGIPFHSLGRVHRKMADQGLLPDANLYPGYLGVLRDVSSTPSSERQSK
jgi:fatty acid desaturase